MFMAEERTPLGVVLLMAWSAMTVMMLPFSIIVSFVFQLYNLYFLGFTVADPLFYAVFMSLFAVVYAVMLYGLITKKRFIPNYIIAVQIITLFFTIVNYLSILMNPDAFFEAVYLGLSASEKAAAMAAINWSWPLMLVSMLIGLVISVVIIWYMSYLKKNKIYFYG